MAIAAGNRQKCAVRKAPASRRWAGRLAIQWRSLKAHGQKISGRQ